jgi:hypothetical protein
MQVERRLQMDLFEIICYSCTKKTSPDAPHWMLYTADFASRAGMISSP